MNLSQQVKDVTYFESLIYFKKHFFEVFSLDELGQKLKDAHKILLIYGRNRISVVNNLIDWMITHRKHKTRLVYNDCSKDEHAFLRTNTTNLYHQAAKSWYTYH